VRRCGRCFENHVETQSKPQTRAQLLQKYEYTPRDLKNQGTNQANKKIWQIVDRTTEQVHTPHPKSAQRMPHNQQPHSHNYCFRELQIHHITTPQSKERTVLWQQGNKVSKTKPHN
jgi:hypothetical protein